jgi:hypothetical protein
MKQLEAIETDPFSDACLQASRPGTVAPTNLEIDSRLAPFGADQIAVPIGKGDCMNAESFSSEKLVLTWIEKPILSYRPRFHAAWDSLSGLSARFQFSLRSG